MWITEIHIKTTCNHVKVFVNIYAIVRCDGTVVTVVCEILLLLPESIGNKRNKRGRKMTEYVYPTKIIFAEEVEHAEHLLMRKDLQIGLCEENTVSVSPGATLVLDFGKELRGGIRILTYSTDHLSYISVRIRFGESLSECYADLGQKNATNDHSPRDIVVTLSPWSNLSFADTGFRFVRIDVLSDAHFEIKSIVAKSQELRKKAIYEYTGDDPEIAAIFSAAKRTIDLCSVGRYVYDGIKRDRLVWVGDMYPEMLALVSLYGAFKPLETSLDFAKSQYKLPLYMYDMPTYSLWWIVIISDYYALTGREKFTRSQLAYLQGLLQLFSEKVDENGQFNIHSHFVDWPTVGTSDEYIGSVFLAIAAYQKGIALLEAFGRDAEPFKPVLKRLMKNNMHVETQKQVIGLKYFALGEISDEEYATLIKDGANGFSTFMSYPILKAIASRDHALAIELMKSYYGAMLSIGATTFFEDFDLKWLDSAGRIDSLPQPGQEDIHGDRGKHCYVGYRHSLCHGWASGVIAFIKEEVSGYSLYINK